VVVIMLVAAVLFFENWDFFSLCKRHGHGTSSLLYQGARIHTHPHQRGPLQGKTLSIPV
jgi:hypothetical protein